MRDSPHFDPRKALATSKAIRSSEPPAAAADHDARVLAFWRRVNRCRECSTIAPWRKFPLGRRGTTRFGLMILGEAPGRVSLDNGRPFSNPRNLMIRRAFAHAVAPREIEPEQLFYFSDTVKCWPPSPTGANRSPSAAENSTCVERHLLRGYADAWALRRGAWRRRRVIQERRVRSPASVRAPPFGLRAPE